MSEPRWFYCRTCGLARKGTDVAPWCRHNDPERKMAATRMIVMPPYHPLACHEPGDAR